MWRLIKVLGLGIGVFLLSIQSVGATPITTLYGVDSSTDSLWEIDPVTGATSLKGRLDPAGDPNPNVRPNRFATPVAMTVRQSDGTIFVWNNSACLDPPGAPCHIAPTTYELVTVNPSTGEATPVSTTPQVELSALAYDAVSSTLYGAGDPPLYTIDQGTGVVSLVAPILDASDQPVRLSGAAFDSCGTLFGLELVNTFIDPREARLFTIDTTTGAATLVGGIANVGLSGSIAFAPDGTLVGSATSIGTLFDIDPETAAVSNARGSGLMQGLGFTTDSPGVCEARITGGGAVEPPGEGFQVHNHSFGVNTSFDETGAFQVNLEYNDGHEGRASAKPEFEEPTPLQIQINGPVSKFVLLRSAEGDAIGVRFVAECNQRILNPDNERLVVSTCEVLVKDNGEPGTGNPRKGTPADEFTLQVVSPGPNQGYTSGEPALIKGNVQAH